MKTRNFFSENIITQVIVIQMYSKIHVIEDFTAFIVINNLFGLFNIL